MSKFWLFVIYFFLIKIQFNMLKVKKPPIQFPVKINIQFICQILMTFQNALFRKTCILSLLLMQQSFTKLKPSGFFKDLFMHQGAFFQKSHICCYLNSPFFSIFYYGIIYIPYLPTFRCFIKSNEYICHQKFYLLNELKYVLSIEKHYKQRNLRQSLFLHMFVVQCSTF